MLLYEPEPTALDLRWRMFGVAIRVHPLFWVLSAFLGWGWFNALGFTYLLLWIFCAFLSILLHEFGHVLMGRVFGSESHILLYSFGGLAIGATRALTRGQRVAVLLAGPGIQLVLWAVLYYAVKPLFPRLVAQMPFERFKMLVITWTMLVEINLVWALLNLLPVWPLDGGQITRELCEAVQGRKGVVTALTLSAVVSGGIAVALLLAKNGTLILPTWVPVGGFYTILLFGLLCVGSIQALQAERERYLGDEDWPWQR